MSDVRSFDFRPEETRAFLDLGTALRKGAADWIPPFRDEQEAALSLSNPFLRRGELHGFIAEEGGRPVARCAAMVDRSWTVDGGPAGMIGFYEAERSAEASRAMFEVALAWLQERGVKTVLGPMNFSIWHGYRLMTRGFDRDAFLGEPRNPPYYPEQFEAVGFTPHARYHSWDLTEEHLRGMLAAADRHANPALFPEAGLHYQPLDLGRFDQQLAEVHRLLVAAFAENPAYSPVDLEEFKTIFGGLKTLAVPELLPMVWKDDRAVGFGYLFPDYAEAIRKMDGQTGLLARARFALSRGKPDRLIFHTVAIDAEHRRKGMIETVVAQLIRYALGNGFKRGVGALAKEGPTMYAKTGEPTRQYVLYRRSL